MKCFDEEYDMDKSPCDKCLSRVNKDECPFPCSKYERYSPNSYIGVLSDARQTERHQVSRLRPREDPKF